MRRVHPVHPQLGYWLRVAMLTAVFFLVVLSCAVMAMQKRTCRTEALDANRTLCICPVGGNRGDNVTVVRGGERRQ